MNVENIVVGNKYYNEDVDENVRVISVLPNGKVVVDSFIDEAEEEVEGEEYVTSADSIGEVENEEEVEEDEDEDPELRGRIADWWFAKFGKNVSRETLDALISVIND